MNTKNTPTMTTAEDAKALGQYVDMVRNVAGADKVDLVAHSMGGLISRYYISNIMKPGTVTRLIMLGTPNMGSWAPYGGLALSPEPADSQNTPDFVQKQTNHQATKRKGVHFFAIGGDIPFLNYSACPSLDGYPSDLVVNHDSTRKVSIDAPSFVGTAPLSDQQYRDMAVTHTGHVAQAPNNVHCSAATDEEEGASQNVFNTVFDTMLSDPTMASVDKTSSTFGTSRAAAAMAVTPQDASVGATAPLTTPVMAAQDARLAPGQALTLTVQASSLTDLNAFVFVPTDIQTTPILTLTSPTGVTSTAQSTGAGIEYQDNSDANLFPFLSFTANNPQDGAWTLTVTNPATNTQGALPVEAEFRTNSAAGLALSAQTDAPSYVPGQTIGLSATLTQVNSDGTTSPISASTGATVTALAASVLDTGSTPQPLTLYDDGAHGAGAPNDGVYGASFTAPEQTGTYAIAITAGWSGQQRVTEAPFEVKPLVPPVTPDIELTPSAASPGASFVITSTACFTPGEQVAVVMGSVSLGAASVDQTGVLSVTETVPTGISGETPVTVTGQSSGVVATAPFAVLIGKPAMPTPTASATPSLTTSSTPAPTMTSTPTNTGTNTPTATATATATRMPTGTNTATPSATLTRAPTTGTPPASATATSTPPGTATATNTAAPTSTSPPIATPIPPAPPTAPPPPAPIAPAPTNTTAPPANPPPATATTAPPAPANTAVHEPAATATATATSGAGHLASAPTPTTSAARFVSVQPTDTPEPRTRTTSG